jgi:hypothetical protein
MRQKNANVSTLSSMSPTRSHWPDCVVMFYTDCERGVCVRLFECRVPFKDMSAAYTSNENLMA